MNPPALLLVRVAMLTFGALEPLAGRASRVPLAEWLASERALAIDAERLSDSLFQLAGPAGGPTAAARARAGLLALRRDLHNRREPRGVSAEALAALPLELRSRIERHVTAAASSASGRDRILASIEQDLASARSTLLELHAAPHVAEAIWLVSR